MKTAAMIALAVALTGCAGWKINGVDFSQMDGGDFIAAAAGVGTSFAIHSLSHMAACEAMGGDCHYDGTSEIANGLSDAEMDVFGHAGFVGQLAVGYAMKWAGVKNSFSTGYNAGTLAEIALYPITTPMVCEGNDINYTGHAAWAGYTLAAAGLFIEKKQDMEVVHAAQD